MASAHAHFPRSIDADRGAKVGGRKGWFGLRRLHCINIFAVGLAAVAVACRYGKGNAYASPSGSTGGRKCFWTVGGHMASAHAHFPCSINAGRSAKVGSRIGRFRLRGLVGGQGFIDGAPAIAVARRNDKSGIDAATCGSSYGTKATRTIAF